MLDQLLGPLCSLPAVAHVRGGGLSVSLSTCKERAWGPSVKGREAGSVATLAPLCWAGVRTLSPGKCSIGAGPTQLAELAELAEPLPPPGRTAVRRAVGGPFSPRALARIGERWRADL